jgi:hypothetical protein
MNSSTLSIIPAQGAIVLMGRIQLAVIAWQIDTLTGRVTPITLAGPLEDFEAVVIDGVVQQ